MTSIQPVPPDDPRLLGLRHLLAVIDRLRAPDGCPWDREQTEASMAPYLIEEAHEWLEAIEEGRSLKPRPKLETHSWGC